MKAIYTSVSNVQKSNCYEFIFVYEHGDADSTEKYNKICKGMTEIQMLNYYKKSEEISNQIDDSRSSGIGLPKNFEETAQCEGFDIPIELDNYTKMSMSNYYASSGIQEVFYYNEQGEKFQVEIK